ncbi:MAG: type VI secretion system tip protein VgrG [Polyangiaceae bacterium]|nr:type VI secretion system tip protein VgrG [Polyangiaceae bacterium]
MRNAASHATFEVSGSSLEVFAVEGSEGVSTLFTYEIGCSATLPLPSASSVIGAEGTLVLVDVDGRSRSIRGFIERARAKAYDNEQGEIRIVLRPVIFDLTLGKASRTFQSSTILDILQTVLGRHAGSTRFAFPNGGTIAYRVQRDESDWDFIARTLADAGLMYWFDHARGGSLVIADGFSAADPLEGDAIPVLTESFIGGVDEGIVELGSGNAAGFTAHAAKGFRWGKPALDVSEKAGQGGYESYEYVLEVPGLKSVGGSLMKQAQGRADAQRITGVVRSVRFAPGISLPIDDGGDIAGKYVIQSVSVSAERSDDAGSRFNSFTFGFAAASGSSAPQPEPPKARRSHNGLSHAIVTAGAGDEVFPDESAQVRAQLHWDRGGAFNASSGTWLRATQRLAPASMMIPRTGWVLATIGQRGSADMPIGLGRIFDGEHVPPYGLPETKTRVVYKTATVPGGGSFNEIHFEDKKGAEVMFIHASKDTEILTRYSKSEIIHNDARHFVDGQQTITVNQGKNSNVKLTQTTVIGRDEIIEVDGDMSKSVHENETITIGGGRTIRGKMGHSTTVGKDRKLKVGAALIDISLGQISREAKNALTLVGGVLLRIAGQSVSRRVGPVWLETVGGMKYVKSGYSITDSSAKNTTEMIGGSVMLEAGTTINEDSSKKGTWTVVGKLSGDAKEGLIEAHDKIEIRCGKSVLTVEPDGLTFSSPQIELEGKELELITAVIEHN